MLTVHDFPILEFDDCSTAKLNPEALAKEQFGGDKMVITFFPEVIKKLLEENAIRPECVISGENPVPVYAFTDSEDTMITLGQVGCPACGGNLDLFIAMGTRRVMFCGGGGVLDKDIGVGHPLVVDGAIRDEGFSYHYVPASRYIYTDQGVADQVSAYMTRKGIPHLRGLVWTTDAIFRETKDRIDRRRQEGAKIVEMEQAGCIAVSQCRGIKYGAIIYGGDDCASEEWSNREWRSRNGIRYDLVRLCKEIVQEL